MTSLLQRSEPANTATTPGGVDCGPGEAAASCPHGGVEGMTDHSRGLSNKRIKMADLELCNPIGEFTGLQGYMFLQLILRWQGRPFSKLKVPVRHDRCSPEDIIRALRNHHYAAWTRQLLSLAILHPVADRDWNITQFLKLPPPPVTAVPSVSVAVCTRDRSADLARCLESLAKLESPPFEILVIDNAPQTNATRDLVEKSFPGVRYVREPRPGLDWARNRAIHEAKGEIIAYTDDDVVVDARWTLALAEIFGADDDIMAVTGLVLPYELETDAQMMFEDYGGFDRGFTRRWHRANDQEKRCLGMRYAGSGQFGTGANMAYRRSVFAEIGLFDPALDVGTVTNGGGDLEMFFRVLKHGHTLVYEPAAMVWHRHRRTYDELRKQIANNGIGFYSHLVRNAHHYPEERRALLKLGLWWFYYWNVRRLLKSYYQPPPIPRDLMIAELKGSLIGLRRYRQAEKNAGLIIDQHGEQPGIVSKGLESATQEESRSGMAVRTLEVTSAAESIVDVTPYNTTALFVTWNGTALGKVVIGNRFRKIRPARITDEVVHPLMVKLLHPVGEDHQGDVWGQWITELKRFLVEQALAASPADCGRCSASVVLATCDRPADLERALASLALQRTSHPFEVIVVDNRPQSGVTPPVVEKFSGVRLVSESRGGLSYARNAGFAAATGDILVCTDDDVTMPEDWLENTLAPFCRNDVMVVAGNVLPAELEAKSQIEFENYGGLGRGFQRREYDRKWFDYPHSRVVPTWTIGATANAAVRAAALVDPEIGMMNEALGAGTPAGVGEDTYLFYKVLKAGYTVVYEPASRVWHYHRATDAALDQQIYAYSRGHAAYHLITWINDGDTRGVVYLCTTLAMYHFKQLLKWMGGSRKRSLRTIMLEIRGNAMGGIALWSSLRRVRRMGRSEYAPPGMRGNDSPMPSPATTAAQP